MGSLSYQFKDEHNRTDSKLVADVPEFEPHKVPDDMVSTYILTQFSSD